MNNTLSKEIILAAQKQFPSGTVFRIRKTDDELKVKEGEIGTINGIDNNGVMNITFDDNTIGEYLFNSIEIKVIGPIEVTCKGEVKKWRFKEEAIDYYQECANNSEGIEKERYSHIIEQLYDGFFVCNDDEINEKIKSSFEHEVHSHHKRRR